MKIRLREVDNMAKFHINKHGVPAPCRATEGNCPLGGEGEHFDKIEDAQAHADKVNAKNHGTLPGASQYEMELNEFEGELEEVTSTERAGFNSSLTYEDSDSKIREKLEAQFGEDTFVVEVYSEDEDPLNYALHDNGGKVEEYYQALAELDESVFLWSPTEDDWSPRFAGSLREHLRENEGPVEDVYGRKMRKALDPYDGGEFMRDYVQFNEEFKTGRAGLNTTIAEEEFDRPAIADKLQKEFGKDSFVVEKFFPDEDPLEYALYDSDGKIEPYYEALEEVGDSPHVWHEETNSWDNEFKESLRAHLKENEGESKEVYGVKLQKALDPHEGGEYVKSYVEFNDEFRDGFSGPAGLHTSIVNDDFSEPTVNHLREKFGDDSFVTEKLDGEGPLSYSIDAFDGRSEPYHEVRLDPEFSDKVWDEEQEDWNEDLKRDLTNHLKSNEGPVKDVYGIKMFKAVDPHDGAEFIREWARNRK